MKAQMLKIAGVKSEKEFYKKFPDEASFMKAHGKEFKKAMRSSNLEKAQTGRNLPTAREMYQQNPLDVPMKNLDINKMMKPVKVPGSALVEKTAAPAPEIPGMSPYVQAAGDVIGGLASLKQQKQDVAGAKQKSMLTGVQAQAAGIRPETPKRQYIRPEDVVYQPEQMFPSYGVGTNVLARDGAMIGGNPTEIMNTFAPNTIYSDMGYEPLSDSDRVKQFYYGGGIRKAQDGFDFSSFMTGGGGGALSMGARALTSKGGYEEAGSKIGGGIGQAAGTAIGGPLGGAIGKVAGEFIGGAIDQSSEQIAAYNEESQQNMGEIMGSQAGVRFQNQFNAFMRSGGILKAQKGEDLTKKDGECVKEEKQKKVDAELSKASALADKAGELQAKQEAKQIAATHRDEYVKYINERLDPYGNKLKQKDFDAAYQAFAAQNPELAKDRLLYTVASKELPKLRSEAYSMRSKFSKVDPNIDYKTLTLPQLMQTLQKGFGGSEGYLKAWNEGFPERLYSIPQLTPIKQENGGQTSDYQWVSHTWQPQVITQFGEHKLSDLLRPPADADMLRAGGEVRNLRKNYMSPEEEMMTQMAFGGQLETTWGGYAEPISQNPYLPGTGQTVMFRGQSHDESDGKGRTGIGVKYGQPDSYTDYAEYGTQADADVEVERNEPAVELPNGDGDNSMVVYGNLKIPNQFLSEIGDPKAKGKKFKSYVKDLSKKEERQNKIIEKASEQLDSLNPVSPFDELKFNSLAANIKGANMKLKQYAEFKQNAAAVQNAINDTAEEMQLDADKLAKGRVAMAKLGANIPKAQNGLETDLGEDISDEDLNYLNDLYEKAKAQKEGPAVTKFQQEFHRLLPKAALKYNKETKFLTAKARKLNVKKSDLDKIDVNNPAGDLEKRVLQGNEDKYFGPITTKYMEIARASAKKRQPPTQQLIPLKQLPPTTGKTETTEQTKPAFNVSPYKRSALIDIFNQVVPYLRPSDAEQLDPNQLVGEMYAMSQNQLEPVWAQQIQPRLATPVDVSLQDIVNENEATYRGQQRLFGYSPAAQSALAAQKYAANQKVLGEQFRMNQGERQRVYEQNRNILNQYDLSNMGTLDRQYGRQAKALSETKATTQAALNSIASKVAQNKLENRTLATYENLYNYRFDPRFRAINMNPLYQPNLPTVYAGSDGTTTATTAIGTGTTQTGTPGPTATPPIVPAPRSGPSVQIVPPGFIGPLPPGVIQGTYVGEQPDLSTTEDDFMRDYYERSRKGSKVTKNKSSKEARNSSIVKALKNL